MEMEMISRQIRAEYRVCMQLKRRTVARAMFLDTDRNLGWEVDYIQQGSRMKLREEHLHEHKRNREDSQVIADHSVSSL